MSSNLKIPKADLDFIRSLEDFDLIMLLSEIHYHGWANPQLPSVGGKALIPLMRKALVVRAENEKIGKRAN